MTAQASARELVTVEGKTLERLEYRGIPVVTFRQVDQIHGNKNEDTSKRFHRNKKHFTQGTDYFPIQSGEARGIFGITAPSGLNLLTESGYLMIAKTFTDDLAWKVQRQLVDNYFRRNTAPVVQTPNPMDILKTMFAVMQEQQAEQSAIKQELAALRQELSHIKQGGKLKQVEMSFTATKHAETESRRTMDNPVYARFKKLHPTRTLTWFKKRHKIPLAVESLSKLMHRNVKVSPVTLAVICSHLKFTHEELREAAKYFGIKDKFGVFDLYHQK